MHLNDYAKDLSNEIRAIDKLCKADRGEFLVEVFHHGPSTDKRSPYDGHYYFDMELCLGNLHSRIHALETSTVEILTQIRLSVRDKELEENLRKVNLEVCSVLIDILQGLNFVHALGEVHRDLKPSNGLKLHLFQISDG